MAPMELTEPTEPKVLHTPLEVANLLSCSRTHVYRLIASGALPVLDIALPGSVRAKTRISNEALTAYLKKASVT